jgi:hypothetical protein
MRCDMVNPYKTSEEEKVSRKRKGASNYSRAEVRNEIVDYGGEVRKCDKAKRP